VVCQQTVLGLPLRSASGIVWGAPGLIRSFGPSHRLKRGGPLAYKNPTLDEVYAELFCDLNSLRAEDFFSVVPRLAAVGFSDVEFADTGIELLGVPLDAEGQVIPKRRHRVRCWLPDHSGLAQVAEDLLAVNLVGEYPGWDRFRELFSLLLASGREGLPDASFSSLSLTTIDRFKVPRSGDFRFGEYIQCGGRFIPEWYKDAREGLDVNLGLGFLATDHFNRKVSVRLRLEEEEAAFQLRAEFHNQLAGKDPEEVLEDLHRDSNATFEAIITDRVRMEVMGGVK